MFNREKEWIDFSEQVKDHIINYTLMQYKDADWENPENGDVMQHSSIEDIQQNLRRYVARMNSNARGEVEAIRDLLKIAHYAAIVWGKYMRKEISTEKIETLNLDSSLDEETKKRIENLIKDCLYGDKQITISFK